MEHMISSFLDELEKIAESAFGAPASPAPPTPAKPGEVKMPMSPPRFQNQATNGGSRVNVEAPGTDLSVTMSQKTITPPPIRM